MTDSTRSRRSQATRKLSDRQASDGASSHEESRAELSELRLGRTMAVLLPSLCLASSLAVGFTLGLAPALLALAGGALLGTIALLWASIRTLSGDAPVEGSLAAVSVRMTTGPGAQERKRVALRALKDIELEHSVGKIDDDDYEELSSRYREVAKTVMREMDVELGPLRERAERIARSHLEKRGLDAALEEPSDREELPASRAERPCCPRCETANEPDAEFCKSCGKPMRRSCLSCETSNEPDASFCKRCGAALEPGEDVDVPA